MSTYSQVTVTTLTHDYLEAKCCYPNFRGNIYPVSAVPLSPGLFATTAVLGLSGTERLTVAREVRYDVISVT